jgi:glycerate 2-kinase
MPGQRLRVVVAPDKFKGSLSAADVAEAVAAGLRSERDDVDVECVPIADGGDGTLDAAVAAGYERVEVEAPGPTGERVKAGYARQAEVGVFELAEVVGLNRLPGGAPAPLDASTYGLGLLIRHALDRDCRHLVLALGGSASTDGGAGMVQALGGRVLGATGDDLPQGGGVLTELADVDLDGLHPALAVSRVVVASDVENPLLGPSGAAAVYGPQKGASAEDIALLERGLQRWADAVARATGADLSAASGAGAAGGTGFAALAVLHGELRPGIDLVLELVRFADVVQGAALVVTGEGSLDEQSLQGKAPIGVARAAARAGVPVVAVAGRSLLGDDDLQRAGIRAAYPLSALEPDPRRSMTDAAELLERVGARIAREQLPAATSPATSQDPGRGSAGGEGGGHA